MIRSILFPPPLKFKFYRDAFLFIGVLSILAAIGFVYTIYLLIDYGVRLCFSNCVSSTLTARSV